MSFTNNLPSQPIKFLIEITIFVLLCAPGILWAGFKKLQTPKQKSVSEQVVLVTGTGRGLGRELALRFGKLGAKVACVDVDEVGNHETAKMIKCDGGMAADYKCDVSDRDQIKALHARVRDELGPVDVLINNAGLVWGHSFIDPTKDQFIIDIVNVNMMGQIWMIREILPSMLERNKGHIVAISSMSATQGVPCISSYTTTKWAINGMMESLNNELKETLNSDVKTTTVMPYFVQTNQKVSEMLEIRFPEISTKDAGKSIIKGILEEHRIFSVPGHMAFFASIIRLLPDNLQEMFNRIITVRFIPEPSSEEIIKKYKQKKRVMEH